MNEQFPRLASPEPGLYRLLDVSQSDPKGYIQVWQAKMCNCNVSLTGALTSLALEKDTKPRREAGLFLFPRF
jgi:hypothetical protein